MRPLSPVSGEPLRWLPRAATAMLARVILDFGSARMRATTVAIDDLPWPDPTDWAEALRSSDAVTVRDPDSGDATGRVDEGVIRPLVFDGTRVYLERYWRYERRVGDLLLEQSTGHSNGLDARSIRTEVSAVGKCRRSLKSEGTERGAPLR